MPKEELAKWVTFQPNLKHPIHNWFYFKEGFSKELVDWIINQYDVKKKIYDPFCGVGTTLLVAKEKDIKSIGIDVSPLAVFVSKVKTRNYDIEKLKTTYAEFKKEKIQLQKGPKLFRKFFYGKTFEMLFGIKKNIEEIEDEKVRDFFMLALMDAAAKVALVRKVGGSLRKIKKHPIPIKKIFLRKVKKMITDIEKVKLSKEEPIVMEADARNFYLGSKASAIITSPPYLNKIEYTTVYKLELGIFFRQPETKLRSYIADEIRIKPIEKYAHMPLVAQAYFADMEKVLENMYKSLKKNGLVFIVVAGGCFPDRVINSDEIIAKIAEEKGFNLLEIIFARKIPCMKARSSFVGYAKESIVVLEKI